MIFQSLRCSVHALNTLKSDVLGYQQQSTTYVEARGRQAVQNFRYALLFKISIPVLNIDELELNVGNRLSGVQMIGDLGAPGRA